MARMRRFIFLGAPGAGKGTQAVKLGHRYSIPQVSTGDILRKAVKDMTKLGKKAASFMEQGKLVPDEVVIGMIRERLGSEDCQNGFILDGFPRTVPQAEALEEVLNSVDKAIDKAIDFDVPDEDLIKRLCGRRVCKSCGINYNIYFGPPQRENACDKCGGDLYQRQDDNEETIKNRLKVYHQQTEPLIEFYKQDDRLIIIDGTGSVDEIFDKLIRSIEENDNTKISTGD